MKLTPIRWTAAMLALIAVVAPAVSAQDRPAEFDAWVVPGWAFTPSLSLAGVWDSNVALAANQAEGRSTASDRLFMIEPHGQLEYRAPRTDFVLGYKGYVRRYLSVEGLNGYDQRAYFSVRHRATKRINVFANSEFADVPTTDEVELNALPFARSGSKSNRLATGMEVRLTPRTGASVLFESTWIRFDNQTTFLTSGVMNGLKFDYTAQLSQRTTVGAEYRVRHARMNDDTGGAWFHDVGGILEHAVSPHVTVALAGGYSRLIDPRLADTRSGPYLRADITREGEHMTVGAGYERSYAAAFGFGGSSSNHNLRGYVYMPFSRNRFYVQTTADWRQGTPLVTGDLAAANTTLATTLGYGVTRWLRLETFHAYTRQDSEITGGEVNRHRAGAQIVVSQPMRIQ